MLKAKKLLTLILFIALVPALTGSARLALAEGRPGQQGSPVAQAPVGSAFTYQGRLTDSSGNPTSATCDFKFSLYDSVNTLLDVVYAYSASVEDGLFTVQVEFDASRFTGEARWVEVAVKCTGDSSYQNLLPRQELTAAPYALSLRPGAVIEGEVSVVDPAVLKVENTAAEWEAYGLYAISDSSDGLGVWGEATSKTGTAVGIKGTTQAASGHGVYGAAWSTSGTTHGVYGEADPSAGYGVCGTAPTYGVYGEATGTTGVTQGVYGQADSPTDGRGVHGYSPYVGVWAEGGVVGLWADSYDTSGETSGVRGLSSSSQGYGGIFFNTAGGILLAANDADSTSDLEFKVDSNGAAYADGGWQGAADFAELMSAEGDPAAYEAGDVLLISAESDRSVALSSEPFSTMVVGVYSGKPGFVGSSHPMEDQADDEIPVAVVGIVPCKVSAENGPIARGDLLVTSATPGHEMRAGEAPPIGTVNGKALEGLDEGTGIIQMLVMLQ